MNNTFYLLKDQYRTSLQAYMGGAGETALLDAHILGRRALAHGLGILKIAEIHQHSMIDALQGKSVSEEVTQIIKRCTDFFLENLSVYEMIESNYLETSTKLHDLHKTLDHNRRFLNDIVAAVPSGLLVFNGATGRLLSTNKSFCEKFRIEPNEISGKPISEVLDLLGLSPEAKEAIQARNPLAGFECECNSPRAGRLVLNITLTCGRLENEEELCLMADDITERRRLQQEMARLERMNLIGEMAAGIGHEIRNPMTAIRGFLQLLEAKEVYSNDKRYFELMIDELDRANSIISEFLSLARNKTVDLQSQNLNDIINAILPLLEAAVMQTDNYIEIELGCLPDLLLNEKEIRQLIFNLVRNAREAMSSAKGKAIFLRTYRDGDEVIFEVKDHGPGIEPHILDKLGTPFLTTKENGTGLGLSVCYSIAARHNANITFDTGPEGTTFYVHFKSVYIYTETLSQSAAPEY